MPSRKEIEEQIAELQAQAAEADANDYECHVQDSDGRTTRLTGRHAKSWLQRAGIIDPDKPAGDGGDGGDEDDPDPKPKKSGVKFFD